MELILSKFFLYKVDFSSSSLQKAMKIIIWNCVYSKIYFVFTGDALHIWDLCVAIRTREVQFNEKAYFFIIIWHAFICGVTYEVRLGLNVCDTVNRNMNVLERSFKVQLLLKMGLLLLMTDSLTTWRDVIFCTKTTLQLPSVLFLSNFIEVKILL